MSGRPIEMGVGALIEYRLRLHGLPVRWRTQIEEWDPPHRFADAQLSGPCDQWHHTHTFRADGEGATVLGDRVRYAIPFGPLGEAARSLFVERDWSGSSTPATTLWRRRSARARKPRL